MRLLSLVVLLLALTSALPAAAQALFGSGSTFIFPIMSKWINEYEKATGAQIGYQPIGSSAGIEEIRESVVDFAVSDAPLDDAQLLRDGLVQFPLVIGAIVPVVNLDGIGPGQLRFTGRLLADIYLGKVRKWNDAAITELNPGVPLPNRSILVIYRTDGSGTTFNWADFLSKSSPEWNARVGTNTSLTWPIGAGGKGNRGVADAVMTVKGAIGYVEYSYALRRKLAHGLVRNRAGNFVSLDAASFLAPASSVEWTMRLDFYVLLTDAPGDNAYPIMATSFGLLRKYPKHAERTRDMIAFFQWALEKGGDLASALDYLPLPIPLVGQVENYWQAEIK
ncbi:MAG TPA: phosphate ABC transporter substrate-binding protein PstS [Acetobacteraceae bacterium]